MTGDNVEDEAAKELEAAATAVTSDAAADGNHLTLYRNADGTYAMRAKLSLAGVTNLFRLIAAVDDVVGRRDRSDTHE